jgi:hypothetical protein
MHPARGDRKPCSIVGCVGTMQFGRRLQNVSRTTGGAPAPPTSSLDAPGWICSKEPGHFREVVQA